MILLGIGSNLASSFGDRFKNIDLAVSSLVENGIKIIKKSSYYESLSYPDPTKPNDIITQIGTSLYKFSTKESFKHPSVDGRQRTFRR